MRGYGLCARLAIGGHADAGGRDGMGGPCGKERAREDVGVPEKPERAHMQAQRDMEGRDAVEGGEDMKSTKRFKAALAAVLVLALSPLFGGAAFAEDSSATTYGGNKTAVTDPSTIWDWQGLIENDTSSVGRIWTDKTVSDNEISKNGVTVSKENGADFLTALTALSSTSNLSDTATTPLDIVLVLDASGSMNDPMGSGDTTKRIVALQNAANSFIDEIAKQNATVKDAAKQHQVAIVKFAGDWTDKVGNDRYWSGRFEYNYSQVMKALAPCTAATEQQFKDQVGAIRPAGATRADNGMSLATGVSSGRSDAKKIVVFFTDGTPTDYSEFEPKVASSAVGYAKDMKDAGAVVYSIGIFKDANPDLDPVTGSASDENKFMHAVSSNYPSATYTETRDGFNWNFGDRAKGSDGKDATFYKSATNADELKQVFDDISKEISKGAGYPTKTREGYESREGYITFDDQLGDYMQVTDLSKLVYNGTVYGCKSKTTDGNVDTYHFSGDVHSGLAAADLKDVVITVTRSDDAAVGDKVQVKVPASLIPLRNFAIDLAKDTMSVSNTTPISVLYSSGVKPAALDLLENPNDAMKAYMEKNTDATGKVNFYANKWTGKETGDAVATFQPATGNSYYYFTKDTPIYTDEACTKPAKSVESGSTYYYKHDYYAMENGKPVAKTEHVSFPGDAAEQAEGVIAKDSAGACYFKSGAPRLTYINELHKVKTDNPTATAADVLNPKWSGTEQSAAQTQINAYLGNNGKLSMDVPGTLTVTKQLKLPAGYNAADFANDSFEFTIAMQGAVGKNFNAVVKNANGEQQGDKFVLAFGQDGQAKHSLKPGETLYVYGLSDGWDYKVSETPRDGFTAKAAGEEGKIAAGKTSAVTYENTYAASGTLVGETYLKGEKVLTGRDWLADTFVFIMKDADTSVEAPMPPNTLGDGKGERSVTVTSKDAKKGVPVSFHFENIDYTKPGTYTYQIWESEELSQLRSGVSASQALYQVVVTVTDEDHNGTLTVKSKMTKLAGDDGVKYEKPQPVETASFVNEYDTSVVKWTPSGTKTYTDMTGENPLKSDMFHVIACTDNANAPLPVSEGVTRVDHEWGGKMWYGALTTVEAGGGIAWPSATFTFNDIPSGKYEATFEYKIVEVVKVGDTWRAVKDVLADKTFDPTGMAYDQTVWTAKVTIADVGGTLELSAKYYKNDSEEPIAGSMFSFDNSYKPGPAVTAITGTKVLTGRDMAEGETFGFKLSAADKATQEAIDAGTIVIPEGADEASVSGAKVDVETGFSFKGLTFSKPGTYSFAVQESKYCGKDLDTAGAATGGIVFDRHAHKVTVTVTDDHSGTLSAKVDNGPANFVNEYKREAQFSGITVQKTLNGRDMAADEFSFSIHGVKSDTVSAEDADARLADSDRSFTNAARADGVACDMAKMQGVTFSQDDIGKTFAYEVREVVPAAADAKPGVSYDDSVHTLEITVGMSSDADKHLTLTTKLDGTVVDPAIVAFVNGYQATKTSYDTATAGLNKVLEGRDWIDSDNFTFELKALDGGPLPKDAAGKDVTTATVTKANAESFGFGTIEFTSDMVKAEPDHKRTFTYEVREVVPADGHKLPGIQYDDNVATIKVTVSDDGSGMLKASAVAENTRFVNRYAAEIDYTAAGGLNVAKTLTGRDMAEGQFTIKVTPGDEASAYALGLPLEGAEIAMPAAADGAQAVKSALGGQHVVLRQNDVGKTYTYKVVEAVGEKVNGYTYDTTEYTVTVTVEDNPQQAALTVKTVVAGGPDGTKTYVYGADPSAAGTGPAVVPFANAYVASTDSPGGTAAQVKATKELTGRPLSADEFTFAVKYAAGGDDLRTAKNAADGTVTFDALHYTTEMLEGLVKDGNASKTSDKGVTSWTVSYLAYEKTDGLAGQGITAQTQPIPFKVTVVDNGDGSLTATANLDKGLKFENTYSTGDPVQVGLSGVKTLQAAPGLDPVSIEGKFTFTVTSDDAAAPMPEPTTAKNEADGSVDFGTIKFTLDDLNRALGVNDQTAAADADKAEADAAKAADQAAAPAKETDADAAKAADADASKAAADADKAATDADNASAQAADDGDKPAAADEGDKPAASDGQGAGAVAAPGAANGTVDEVAPGNQPANPEPESGKPRSHVFTYKVTESGSVPGVINDAAATKTVSFKVTDDGAGKLTVERQGDAANPAFSFANTYTVGPANSSVTDQVAVTKTLTGRDMAAGEFAFELLEGEDVVATGANAADGSVTLSAVKYTQPGTHRYTLHEVGGGTVANGVTYDGATYTVVTTVKDNGDGTLSVTHALESAREATFANAYQATSTTVTIGASKTLVGKNLQDGQFTFVLTAADGTELKAKNAADGKIAFPALTFDKPGTYEFALTELDDAQANVTYDKHAYKVTVTVVDDGLGHLNATVAGDADVLAFTNTYTEPPTPVQPAQPGGKTFTPSGLVGKVLTQTGDDKLALVLPLAAVTLAGAASIAALVIMRRRDKR